ncbi:MAG: hypothetical protein Q8N35_01105 [Methylococcaceae bacterium]|uniref:hypothetical protein n=1 Tax=Methylicorpusculum sp. TaxID=2713644 RepID=UPI00271D8BF7|nr:hypothetical protein [Methylicorpusculum sp.]MDO9162054.1 hypothetical protein [Methylococcaceae bacterium]MDZ4156447.1 hypothetical protein [Methylococcales bacterium]MDP2391663.1 hypothetical protein [Methylococcaceae bacterium]MDP3018162.1 hypothetical protein [Methylococcaceae bacterium]MDP3389375.1 hypothetical protein [Methylococcaceae bacterium]
MTTGKGQHKEAQKKLESLFDELLRHDGFGDLRLEMRLLKRGQKEVIIYCGKQYRYVVDFQHTDKPPVSERSEVNNAGI